MCHGGPRFVVQSCRSHSTQNFKVGRIERGKGDAKKTKSHMINMKPGRILRRFTRRNKTTTAQTLNSRCSRCLWGSQDRSFRFLDTHRYVEVWTTASKTDDIKRSDSLNTGHHELVRQTSLYVLIVLYGILKIQVLYFYRLLNISKQIIQLLSCLCFVH